MSRQCCALSHITLFSRMEGPALPDQKRPPLFPLRSKALISASTLFKKAEYVPDELEFIAISSIRTEPWNNEPELSISSAGEVRASEIEVDNSWISTPVSYTHLTLPTKA